MAKTRTSFAKGKSGNPAGRPKRYPEFVESMRECSEEAAEKLTNAASEGRPWAIQLVLAYAWGRPHESKLDLSEHTTEQLAAELRSRLGPPRAADGDRAIDEPH